VTEADTQDAIRLAAHSLGLVLWRNSVGLAVDGLRRIRYGLAVGSSDLIGIIMPEGRFIALEVKSATGRPTPEQERFLDLVRRSGGFAAVVRSVEDVRAAVERARRGESQ
jgi:hypothetical protein